MNTPQNITSFVEVIKTEGWSIVEYDWSEKSALSNTRVMPSTHRAPVTILHQKSGIFGITGEMRFVNGKAQGA